MLNKRYRRLALDTEANGLKNPTKLWCICLEDLDTGEEFAFHSPTPLSGHVTYKDKFKEFLKTVKEVWVHNGIGYDMWVMNLLLGEELFTVDGRNDTVKVIDTLVLSRLARPTTPPDYLEKKYLDTRIGGHSLEAWGKRLGVLKGDFSEWDRFSEQMLIYCRQDVKVLVKIIEVLKQELEGFSEECIILEHYTAEMLRQQELNGFFLDKKKARKLVEDCYNLQIQMDIKLQELFPPAPKFVRNLIMKTTLKGEVAAVPKRILEQYQKNPKCQAILKDDGSYDLYVLEEFNPQSPAQVGERLQQLGWIPKKKTKKGAVAVDKETLKVALSELLQARTDLESLRCLADYNIVVDRLQKASKWLELAREDGYVHGKVLPIGASTHRMSHYDDNMANIARVVTTKLPPDAFDVSNLHKFDPLPDGSIFLKKTPKEIEVALTGLKGAYGWDCRDCWTVPDKEKQVLVGCDAAGIQLRALAHYINDPIYTETLLSGDIHEYNRVAAGISTRAKAKTFI